MSLSARILPRLWLIIPVCALGWVVWAGAARVQRIQAVSALQGRARPVDALDRRSPTGYADGQRELIIPGASQASFHWIAQTQQMFARGEARVRHVDYENAPNGHDVSAASPYRWWLGLVAWVDHGVSGRPIGLSVERAALYADPLLHGLLIAAAAAFAAWRFGCLAAAVLSLGLATLFPFASGFLPGMPGAVGLEEACGLGTLLLLLAGISAPGAARRWFALAGVMGGLGIWIDVKVEAPITGAVVLGALLAGWVGRGSSAADPPWRVWSRWGGTTVLAAYLAEYFPSHMGFTGLDSVHPAYGLAWIGAGELLSAGVPWVRGARPAWARRNVVVLALAALAVAALPAAILWTGSWGFLVQDSSWARLSRLSDSAVAASTGAWLSRDGMTAEAWATLVPLLVLLPGAWMMVRPGVRPETRASLAVAFGPALAAGGLAWWQLSWWGALDGALLAIVVAATADGAVPSGRSAGRWLCAAIVLACAAGGAARLMPRAEGPELHLTPRESEELVERHLSHWMARRTGEAGAVVYASPDVTAGLCFFGGLRGVGSAEADNGVGFGAALNIAAALTMEEAQNDMQARGISYIVVPSWDRFFDEFARLYLDKRFASRPNFFVGELRKWNLPRWLRPVPYQMPVGGGFEGQTVQVFEVVDEQAPSAAAGRLAEYMVETGDLERAAAFGEALRKYPGDVGALAARMMVAGARGDSAAAAEILNVLLARLASGADRYVPWDRRISLAIVLAQAGRVDLARGQASQCLAAADEARLRTLSTGALYNLLVLGRAFGLEIADPHARAVALDLLPDDLRGRL